MRRRSQQPQPGVNKASVEQCKGSLRHPGPHRPDLHLAQGLLHADEERAGLVDLHGSGLDVALRCLPAGLLASLLACEL